MQTGPRIYNLFPLLAGSMKQWHDHLPRIAAMGFDWIFVNPFQWPGFSGSLYAIQDPRRLHMIVQGDSPESPDELMRAFMADAARHGLSVMMDLVINHTAKDALLTGTHPEWYQHEPDGSLHSPFAVDPDDPRKITVWGDLASLDYKREDIRSAQLGYWNDLVGHWISLGVRGFRCDAAYQVPVAIWRPIIENARRIQPNCLFAAETLGCTTAQVAALNDARFDLLFNSSKWWDWRAPWLLDQYEQFREIGPSVAFPESHDTPRLVTELHSGDNGYIERQYRLRYAFAAVFSAGVMLPMGYEYGFGKPLHVVSSRPEDWTAEATNPRIDLTRFVAAVNAMKAACRPLNVEGVQLRLTQQHEPLVGLARFDAARVEEARSCAIAMINPDPGQTQWIDPATVINAAPVRLSDIGEVTPERAAEPFEPGRWIGVEPLGVRVYAAQTVPR